MAQKKPSQSQANELAKVEQKQQKQQKLLKNMEKREQWMKWLIIGLLILVLLLILFFGYATDWTQGLRKDSTSTDTAATLDATKLPAESGASTIGTTSASGSNGSNGTSGSNGGSGTTSKSSDSAKESSNTTTNNSTTSTTNNTTATTGTTTGSDGLLALYSATGVGDNISSVLGTASSLAGVTQDCHTELLVQVCNFIEDGLTVTTKNLLGTGIITSVTKNL